MVQHDFSFVDQQYIANNYSSISVLPQKNGNGYEIANIMYINLAYIEAITYFKPKNLITSRTTAVKFAKIYFRSDSITS